MTVRLTLDNSQEYDLRIVNNILRVTWPDDERTVMSEWSTARAPLIGALTNKFTLAQALEKRAIRVLGNTQGSQEFASLLE